MKAKKIIQRKRNIPGRADGYVFFTLRWGEMKFSHRSRHSAKLDNTIRLFRDKMKLIPNIELHKASAKMEATIRKKEGGLKRITLAKWEGTKPVEEFFGVARQQWSELTKEIDDQKHVITCDLPNNLFQQTAKSRGR